MSAVSGYPILVSAAVLVRDGQVLLTQRGSGKHLAGMWEFPGGKVEPNEDPRDALVRELREELGIAARAGDVLEATFHRYPAKTVLLLFFEASLEPGSPEPQALDVAGFRWADANELAQLEFPPADVAIVRRVRERLAGTAT